MWPTILFLFFLAFMITGGWVLMYAGAFLGFYTLYELDMTVNRPIEVDKGLGFIVSMLGFASWAFAYIMYMMANSWR